MINVHDSIGSGGGAGWIMTVSGRVIEPLNPDPAAIRLYDVAHALAHKCRYQGHTRHFYSVAQHALLVSSVMSLHGHSLHAQLTGLHHDDDEAYLPDIPSPIKPLLNWGPVEEKMRAACAEKLGFDLRCMGDVERYDKAILWDEMLALMPLNDQQRAEAYTKGLGVLIKPWPPEEVRQAFLDRHDNLVWRIKSNG